MKKFYVFFVQCKKKLFQFMIEHKYNSEFNEIL